MASNSNTEELHRNLAYTMELHFRMLTQV